MYVRACKGYYKHPQTVLATSVCMCRFFLLLLSPSRLRMKTFGAYKVFKHKDTPYFVIAFYFAYIFVKKLEKERFFGTFFTLKFACLRKTSYLCIVNKR